jgi:hypothetical protein
MDPEYHFGFTHHWPMPPMHPVKVIPLYKSGCGPSSAGTEEADSGPIGLVGESGMPVFRGKALHPFHISYLNPTFGLPLGCLLIGPSVDLVACAWTISLTAEDRALLEGMRISPNFLPAPALTETK